MKISPHVTVIIANLSILQWKLSPKNRHGFYGERYHGLHVMKTHILGAGQSVEFIAIINPWKEWNRMEKMHYWRADRHFMWSSVQREGQVVCSVKGVSLGRPRESKFRPPTLNSSAPTAELIPRGWFQLQTEMQIKMRINFVCWKIEQKYEGKFSVGK